MSEGVELRESGAALGPQRVRLVQDLRDSPLLRSGGSENSIPRQADRSDA